MLSVWGVGFLHLEFGKALGHVLLDRVALQHGDVPLFEHGVRARGINVGERVRDGGGLRDRDLVLGWGLVFSV